MSDLTATFLPYRASIVKKQFMALTGLMMCGFLLVHLAGNLLLFRGSEAFNLYAFWLLSNPLILFLEWLLAALFVFHAGLGIVLILQNRAARPIGYSVRAPVAKGEKLSFVSMSVTGPLTLLFLFVHLANFKYGQEYQIVQGGMVIRDLYRTVIEYYASPLNALLYIAAMILLALHVQHGFWSAFQSFGLNHPRYNRLIETASDVYALVILLGFVAIPIYFVDWSALI